MFRNFTFNNPAIGSGGGGGSGRPSITDTLSISLFNEQITRAFLAGQNKKETGAKLMNLTVQTAAELAKAARTPERITRQFYEVLERVKMHAEHGQNKCDNGDMFCETKQRVEALGYLVTEGFDEDGDVRFMITW